MSIHLTADQRRQIALEVKQATTRLQTLIGKGDLVGVKRALEEGAVPEWATFANKKGTSLGSALSRAMRHKDMALLDVLLDAHAPLLGEGNKSLFQVAVQLGFPAGFARVAKDLAPTDEDWVNVLEAGMPYVQLLHDQHPLDFSRCLDGNSSLKWPALFHITDPNALAFAISQGADPNIVATVIGNAWKPFEWAISMSKGLEEEKDDMFQSTFGVSAVGIGLELMGNDNPLALLKAYSSAGVRMTQNAFTLALQKGYPDVLVWMLEHNPQFRIGKNIHTSDTHHDPTAQLAKRPQLHRYLLAEQERLDMERATVRPTQVNRGPRL